MERPRSRPNLHRRRSEAIGHFRTTTTTTKRRCKELLSLPPTLYKFEVIVAIDVIDVCVFSTPRLPLISLDFYTDCLCVVLCVCVNLRVCCIYITIEILVGCWFSSCMQTSFKTI